MNTSPTPVTRRHALRTVAAATLTPRCTLVPRGMILTTTFTEEDVLANDEDKIIEIFERRRVVSRGGVR